MTVQLQKTRLERIIEKLRKHAALIDSTDKGSLEINFAGNSETVQIKVVVQ